MTMQVFPKWIRWSLWILSEDGKDYSYHGIITGCFTEDGVITFVTDRGEYQFYTDSGLATTSHNKFTGVEDNECMLLPPSSV